MACTAATFVNFVCVVCETVDGAGEEEQGKEKKVNWRTERKIIRCPLKESWCPPSGNGPESEARLDGKVLLVHAMSLKIRFETRKC